MINRSTRTLLNKVERFLFGNVKYTDKDLEFIIALEDKILSLTPPKDILYWYCDYENTGNLYEFWKEFEYTNEFGRKSYPNCGVGNKSGIRIRHAGECIILEIKDGYGANWDSYTAYLNAIV